MGEIVNLRMARKVRDRRAAERTAAANRALHGQSRAERMFAKGEQDRQQRALEASRRELDDPETAG